MRVFCTALCAPADLVSPPSLSAVDRFFCESHLNFGHQDFLPRLESTRQLFVSTLNSYGCCRKRHRNGERTWWEVVTSELGVHRRTHTHGHNIRKRGSTKKDISQTKNVAWFCNIPIWHALPPIVYVELCVVASPSRFSLRSIQPYPISFKC